jgi:hypothetical protein
MFPAAVVQELLEASTSAGEVLVHSPQPGEQIGRVVYAPELIALPPRDSRLRFAAAPKLGRALSDTSDWLIKKLWSLAGKERNEAPETFKTDRLPILMYHSVAPTGA